MKIGSAMYRILLLTSATTCLMCNGAGAGDTGTGPIADTNTSTSTDTSTSTTTTTDTGLDATCAHFCTPLCSSLGGVVMQGNCADATLYCCDRDLSNNTGDQTNTETGVNTTGTETDPVVVSWEPVPINELPVVEAMPDPLTMSDGTSVTTPEQWATRRQEMIQILEYYEYGHMPPAPGNVTAQTVTESSRISTPAGVQADYRMVHLSFGPDASLGFDLGLFTPTTPPDDGVSDGYPVLISLTYSAGRNSLADASAALSRGYAVATVPYQQLGADAANWASTAFFPAYPEYDWRDFSAWAWGISRAVDYLSTDDTFDRDKIMITGVSRLGQAVLLAGAFDERIALTAPVAGGMAFRYSGAEMGGGLGQGITEIVDQNTYWFGPRFELFRNQTPKLPCDQHWLPALVAPRLFILCNAYADEYGRAYAAVQTYLGALPVYEFLGAHDSLGMHFREGGHGMTAEDWSAILDFADQYLLGIEGDRRFDTVPPANKTP